MTIKEQLELYNEVYRDHEPLSVLEKKVVLTNDEGLRVYASIHIKCNKSFDSKLIQYLKDLKVQQIRKKTFTLIDGQKKVH